MEKLKGRLKSFGTEFIGSVWLLGFFGMYLIVKVTANLTMGASVFTALRSGVFGVLFNLVGCLVICVMAVDKERIDLANLEIGHETRIRGIIAILLYVSFLFVLTTDSVMRRQSGDGAFLSAVPGFDSLQGFMRNNIAVPLSSLSDRLGEPYMLALANGVLWYLILPGLLFSFLGYKISGPLNFRNTRAAWLFMAGYLVAFLVNSPDSGSWLLLAATVIYPALAEEFFHKGIVLRTIKGFSVNEGTAVAISALIFAALHLPERLLITYSGNPLLAFSDVLTVGMFGVLSGYGFLKTGSLIPWILIHALSDVIYVM